MIDHILSTVASVQPTRAVVVVGHGAQALIDEVTACAGDLPVQFAEQREQLGTGHAVQVALAQAEPLDGDEDVVVLPGDAPLLRSATLASLVEVHRDRGVAATLLTARLGDPTGYGRVVRDHRGEVVAIVEHADATDAQRAIDEVNTSIYCFERSALTEAIGHIGSDNAQGEVYLTDVIGELRGAGNRVAAVVAEDPAETRGVNDPDQLAAVEAIMQARI